MGSRITIMNTLRDKGYDLLFSGKFFRDVNFFKFCNKIVQVYS